MYYRYHKTNLNPGANSDWTKNKKAIQIQPCINKYNWEGINFPSERDDWKKFEKSYITIALNVLHAEKENIYPDYVSKHI